MGEWRKLHPSFYGERRGGGGGGGGAPLRMCACACVWLLVALKCVGEIADANGDVTVSSNAKLPVWNVTEDPSTGVTLESVPENYLVLGFKHQELEPLAGCAKSEVNKSCDAPIESEAATARREWKGENANSPELLRLQRIDQGVGRVRRNAATTATTAKAGANASTEAPGGLLCYVCRTDLDGGCDDISPSPTRTQATYLKPCPNTTRPACRVIRQNVVGPTGALSLTVRECAREASDEAQDKEEGACYVSAFGTQKVCECFTTACNAAHHAIDVSRPLGCLGLPLMLILFSSPCWRI